MSEVPLFGESAWPGKRKSKTKNGNELCRLRTPGGSSRLTCGTRMMRSVWNQAWDGGVHPVLVQQRLLWKGGLDLPHVSAASMQNKSPVPRCASPLPLTFLHCLDANARLFASRTSGLRCASDASRVRLVDGLHWFGPGRPP
jgi:hypothetical protein